MSCSMPKRMTFEEFVQKAREVRGDRFEYRADGWKGVASKVWITCPDHGEWHTLGNLHLRGIECPRCAQPGANMTFDEYVVKARESRGDRFSYRPEGWKGISGKVWITCPDHGEWHAPAAWHLKGIECPRCSRPRANMTFDEMVVEARSIHGYQFDYVDEKWTGVAGVVVYDCPFHGRIEQIAGDHLRGIGCRQCGFVKVGDASRMTREEFIVKAHSVHGDRYDYPDQPFGGRTALQIVCRVHGPFKQRRGEHFAGHGCHTCGGRKRRNTEQYIADAKAVHGDRFTYEKTKFVTTTDKVIVTCPIHGDFRVGAKPHLYGNGCLECSGLRRRTTQEFIAEARKKHGDRYDYSLVEYVNSNVDVTIVCASHGPFVQKPVYHLVNVVGCPTCTYSVSRPETSWLDDLGIDTSLRQARIRLQGKSRSVDAFDPSTNTVYEFWGSWWHGDPKVFPPDGVHRVAKKTYAELHRKTMEKRRLILAAGYRLVEVWESEYVGLRDRRGMPEAVGPLQLVLF